MISTNDKTKRLAYLSIKCAVLVVSGVAALVYMAQHAPPEVLKLGAGISFLVGFCASIATLISLVRARKITLKVLEWLSATAIFYGTGCLLRPDLIEPLLGPALSLGAAALGAMGILELIRSRFRPERPHRR